MENMGKWIYNRNKERNNHIERMTQDRIVRIARDKFSVRRRSVRRPTKRWSDNLDLNQREVELMKKQVKKKKKEEEKEQGT